MSDPARLQRIVRITAGLLAALLLPMGLFLAMGDLARHWRSALAIVVVAGLLIIVAIRPEGLPFLDDPAVPDDH